MIAHLGHWTEEQEWEPKLGLNSTACTKVKGGDKLETVKKTLLEAFKLNETAYNWACCCELGHGMWKAVAIAIGLARFFNDPGLAPIVKSF